MFLRAQVGSAISVRGARAGGCIHVLCELVEIEEVIDFLQAGHHLTSSCLHMTG